MSELISLDGFDCAPAHRIASNEQITAMKFDAMTRRVDQLEEIIERLEKRLWLIVFGVAGAILAQAFQSILAALP